MPYRNPEDRKHYEREYKQRTSGGPGRGPGRPPLEDRKIHLSLRIRSSIVGRLQRLLLEGLAIPGKFPWRTQSHQYEDLLIRGLETLRGDESVAEAMQYLHAVSHTDALARMRREAQAAFSTITIELKELRAIGALDQAVAHFWSTYRAFEQMSPHTWRDWFLQRMREDHADLFAKAPRGVSLAGDGDPAEPGHPKRGKILKHARR